MPEEQPGDLDLTSIPTPSGYWRRITTKPLVPG